MENNKLQELTQKLYNDGLEKGRSQAEALLAEAREQADKIVADARAQAESLVKAAEKRSNDIEKNTMTEIALAGRQAVAKIKSELTESVVLKSTEKAVKESVLDAAFVKEMLLTVAKNWSASASEISLDALLPESQKKTLDAKMKAAAGELLLAGVEVGYSADVKSGFKVGPKSGGYYISFTEESFEALLKEYLRDKVANMLYNE